MKPEDVKHMEVEHAEDLVISFLCDVFGWTGMPFAYETISRGLQWELERRVTGTVLIYVDDIFSVSLRKEFQRDVDAATDY
jgi:hypothetical protein